MRYSSLLRCEKMSFQSRPEAVGTTTRVLETVWKRVTPMGSSLATTLSALRCLSCRLFAASSFCSVICRRHNVRRTVHVDTGSGTLGRGRASWPPGLACNPPISLSPSPSHVGCICTRRVLCVALILSSTYSVCRSVHISGAPTIR